MIEDLSKINRIEAPQSTLENMRVGASINAPRSQRDSIKQAKARIKDKTPYKQFSILTKSDYHITVKRTK